MNYNGISSILKISESLKALAKFLKVESTKSALKYPVTFNGAALLKV